MISRREILKLGFLSTLGLSFDAFSVVRDLKILDFKEDYERLEYTLVIRKEKVKVGSREGTGVLVNGQLPGPLLTFKEGKEVIIHVINEMDEPTSIH
jgi:FtsP/CotA-like multicopper oxidase with cupredoxin domain